MNDQNLELVGHKNSEIDLLDLMIALIKHKRLIVGAIVICGLIGFAVAMILPPIYTATARVLPPQQNQSGMSALLGQLGAISGLAANVSEIKSPNDLYVGMMQSQTVADDLISRFKLKDRYNVQYIEDASKKLKDATKIKSEKNGLITIDFSDEDPAFAAAVANAYVEELQKITESFAVTQASQRRLFFEQQLKLAKQKLDDAEDRLKNVQEKSGMLTLDSQVQAAVTGLAQLKATLASKEVALQAMKTFATTENPEYQQLNSEIEELRNQLSRQESTNADGILATQKIPEAGLEYMRRLRDQKFAETVYELMMKQYKLAKIDEAKNIPLVQQLDKASPPQRKSKPSRIIVVLAAVIVGIILGMMGAFLSEIVNGIKGDPNRRPKWEHFISLLKWG